MIKVTVELWPDGNLHKAKILGTMVIANDGTGSTQRGNYQIMCSEHEGEKIRTRRCELKDWPRQQNMIWALVVSALNKVMS